jgi:hypothetical protein
MADIEVAETLLISAVISFGIFFAIWYAGVLTEVQTSQTAPNCSVASIIVKDVYMISRRGVALVENTGQTQLQVVSVNVTEGNLTTALPLNLSVGSLAEIGFNSSCDSFKKLTVLTNCPTIKASWAGLPKGC